MARRSSNYPIRLLAIRAFVSAHLARSAFRHKPTARAALVVSWPLQLLLACFTALVFSVTYAADDTFWINLANDRSDLIRNELALGEDPNLVNSDGQPALMQAVRDGAWKTFDLLLAHRKIDVNAPNKTDETPLMYIAIVGDISRAEALVKRGASINRLGWTPLHYAASKGQTEMTKFLLAQKAIVNAPSPDGTTPLMMAAYDGSEATVRLLLEAGADAAAVNTRDEDAALWARRKQHTALAEKLDDVARRVQARRGATGVATKPVTAADGRNGPGQDIKTVEIQEVFDGPGSRTESDEQADTGSGASYFDLERFEREDNPF